MRLRNNVFYILLIRIIPLHVKCPYIYMVCIYAGFLSKNV